ncbi:p115 like vesicle tethering protein [Hyaloraphidium curvatum]|nr:p115 like vesicle tethering protein [Hyaloraphidium curvatum]
MSFLSAFLAPPPPKTDPGETVSKLVDRLKTGNLAEDRRAAALGLKGLVREYRLVGTGPLSPVLARAELHAVDAKDVGTKGLGVLAEIIKNDPDLETLKAVLETVNLLCTVEPTSRAKDDGTPVEDLAVMFTEIFMKDPSNVSALLAILEETNFYVRFQTVELLGTLLHNRPDQLQDCVLAAPMGLSRLIDLLEDRREAIRNAGLLLLITLTQTNADIQKIVAFENAFERLFQIVVEEGASDGGIVVQDCLNLVHNLLRYNTSNQNLFRESGLVKRLPQLLLSKSDSGEVPLNHPSVQWHDQKIHNAILILELVRILCVPNDPNTTANQVLMNQASILSAVVGLALAPHVPVQVRAQAFYAIADAIRGSHVNQDAFARSVLPPQPGYTSITQPALLITISNALATSKTLDDFVLRSASTYCFQCYVFNNPESQLAVAATFQAPPADNPNSEAQDKPQSAGSIILDSLLYWEGARKDPYIVWFASVLLSHVLRKNEQCKELALAVSVSEDATGDSVKLMHKVMYTVTMTIRENLDVRAQIGLLCVLAVWFYECPPAVAEFLSESSNLSYLIEQVKQSGINPLTQGLAAFLLGLCYEFNDDSEPSVTRATMKPIITNRIGIDLFRSRLERLRESRPFNKVSPNMMISGEIDAKGLPDVFFDYSFTDFFKSNYEALLNSITTGGPARPRTDAKSSPIAGDPQDLSDQRALLTKQRMELESLQQRVSELEAFLASEREAFAQERSAMNKTMEDLMEKLATKEKEEEELLLLLADQDLKLKELGYNDDDGEPEEAADDGNDHDEVDGGIQ